MALIRHGSESRLPDLWPDASYRNGVLEVRVPTPQAPPPGEARRIPITRG